MSRKSHLEEKFAVLVAEHNLPDAVREHVFDKWDDRKWRFDFAWPAQLVAVEIEGGTFSGGRHNRGVGSSKDAEKYNAAAMQGWSVLRYNTRDLRDRPDEMIAEVAKLLEMKG